LCIRNWPSEIEDTEKVPISFPQHLCLGLLFFVPATAQPRLVGKSISPEPRATRNHVIVIVPHLLMKLILSLCPQSPKANFWYTTTIYQTTKKQSTNKRRCKIIKKSINRRPISDTQRQFIKNKKNKKTTQKTNKITKNHKNTKT